jgi:hypothetical protein
VELHHQAALMQFDENGEVIFEQTLNRIRITPGSEPFRPLVRVAVLVSIAIAQSDRAIFIDLCE